MSTRRWHRIDVMPQLILTIAAAFFVAPLVVMVRKTFEGEGAWTNFRTVLTDSRLPRFVTNSLIVSLSTTALVVVVTVCAGYAFAKLRLPFGGVLLSVILLGLMIPSAVIMLPLFVQARQLGLLNSYLALIGPYAALLIPFTIVLAKNYIHGVPDEILDAARMDGCSNRQMLWHVVIPVIRPIVVVVGLWSFLSCWNEYFLANLMMQDRSLKMVTQAPQVYVGEYTQDTGKLFASLLLISLPVLILFLSTQRAFVSGISAGSTK